MRLNDSFKQGLNFKQFLFQFQKYCPQLLCLHEDVLYFYDKKEDLPKNLHFLGHKNEYYFADSEGKEYCVFNQDAATFLSPKPKPLLIPCHSMITLYFNGLKFRIPYEQKTFIKKTLSIF